MVIKLNSKEKDKSAGGRKNVVRSGIKMPDLRLIRYCIMLLFFCFYFIFVLSHVNPSVIYSSSGMNIHNYVAAIHAQEAAPHKNISYTDPWFRNLYILELTQDYLREIIISPGGFSKSAVALLINLCHNPVAGALAVTGLALFFYGIFTIYIKGIGVARPFVSGFVPAFFIIIICARYDLRDCAFLMPVAGALVLAVLYQSMHTCSIFRRILVLSMLFWIAWYLIQWGSLLLLVFIVIHELFNKKRNIVPLVIAAALNAAILFLADFYIIPLDKTIRWSDFTAQSGMPLVMICFFPLAAMIFTIVNRPVILQDVKKANKYAIICIVLFVFGTAVFFIWLCHDPVNRDTRTIARTVDNVMNSRWDAILHEKTDLLFADFPQKAGALQFFMVHVTDHALCRTGLAGDRLFTFPQAVFSDEPLLMLQSTATNGFVKLFVVLDLAMDLGMVNTAEKIAGEIMEKMGPYPEIIYRRALIQAAKGNSVAAGVYLKKLASMPIYRTEAKRLLYVLDNNETCFSEPRIAAMSTNKDTVDYFVYNNVNFDEILMNLLKSNHDNKMAYDYLMTYCLITGQLEDLSVLAGEASAFGYAVLPRYWDEALCLYQSMKSFQETSKVFFSGLRPETIERFNRFFNAYSQIENDPEAAARLAPEFGDSYFYFSIFKHTGRALHE